MMSEEQLVAAAEEAVITADVDTDIELEEEEVQEQVSPEVAAFRADLASQPGDSRGQRQIWATVPTIAVRMTLE